MLLSISIALYDYLKGNKLSEEEVTKRTEACNGCEYKSKSKIAFCKQCKCLLFGELGKIKAPRETCPAGKWDV
jgi:hypothetical protein